MKRFILLMLVLTFSLNLSAQKVSKYRQYEDAKTLIQQESYHDKTQGFNLLKDLVVKNKLLPKYDSKAFNKKPYEYRHWWLISSKPTKVQPKILNKKIVEFNTYFKTVAKVSKTWSTERKLANAKQKKTNTEQVNDLKQEARRVKAEAEYVDRQAQTARRNSVTPVSRNSNEPTSKVSNGSLLLILVIVLVLVLIGIGYYIYATRNQFKIDRVNARFYAKNSQGNYEIYNQDSYYMEFGYHHDFDTDYYYDENEDIWIPYGKTYEGLSGMNAEIATELENEAAQLYYQASTLENAAETLEDENEELEADDDIVDAEDAHTNTVLDLVDDENDLVEEALSNVDEDVSYDAPSTDDYEEDSKSKTSDYTDFDTSDSSDSSSDSNDD